MPTMTKAQLRAMTDAQLSKTLATVLRDFESNLKTIALIWQELKRRGTETPFLASFQFSSVLEYVANDKLLPQLALLVGGNPELISRIAALPHKEQQSLLDAGGQVLLLTPNLEKTEYITDTRPLASLQAHEIRQAFEVIPGGHRIAVQLRPVSKQKPFAPPLRPTPRTPVPMPAELRDDTPTPADLDLWGATTPMQRLELQRNALRQRPPMTILEYVVHLLVREGAMRTTPLQSRMRLRPTEQPEARV